MLYASLFFCDTTCSFSLDGSSPVGAMWNYLADHIRDDNENRNNRFDVAARLNACWKSGSGPFWGCPTTRASETLTTKKPSWPAVGIDPCTNKTNY